MPKQAVLAYWQGSEMTANDKTIVQTYGKGSAV
jgi:hypothetical protein